MGGDPPQFMDTGGIPKDISPPVDQHVKLAASWWQMEITPPHWGVFGGGGTGTDRGVYCLAPEQYHVVY